MKFLIFFTFVGHFRPPWSGSGFRILIRIHWLDRIRIQSGSGSETLCQASKYSLPPPNTPLPANVYQLVTHTQPYSYTFGNFVQTISIRIGLYHREGRVLIFFSSRRNRDSPNPSPAGECAPPPPVLWEGLTRLRERGWGSPNSDEGTYTVVLFIYTHFVVSTQIFFTIFITAYQGESGLKITKISNIERATCC